MKWPLEVRQGSVVVKVYRQKAPTAADGYSYVIAWVGPNGREKITRADLKVAKEEAERKAAQMAQGLDEAKQMSRSDVIELAEIRALAGEVPPLSAMAEWKKAREIVGGEILPACQAWAEGRTAKVDRILVPAAVEKFIAEKDNAGKQGTRTYGAKLKYMKTQFPTAFLDALTVPILSDFLKQFEDGVTRNDIRKRMVALFLWAKKQGYLPRNAETAIEQTERAKEDDTDIGILEPATFKQVLEFLRAEYPKYLAAVVCAGFCGMRSDEIHGKREDRRLRQLWSDVHLDRGFLSVTAAKENTPSNRIVHLSEAALAWFSVCPEPREGFLAPREAMDRVRRNCASKGFNLPDNCFRHSWISYRIALTGDKASTATEAGNSVKEIDKRYRVPLPKFKGEEWFAIRPD